MENNNNYQQNDEQPTAFNHHDNLQDTKNSKKPSKTILYVLIVLGILFLVGVAYYMGTKVNNEKPKNNLQKTQVVDSTRFQDSIQVDGTKILPNPVEYEGEEEGGGIGTNYVLANEAYLRTAPSETATKVNYNLKFGDRVFVDYSYSGDKYSKVYLTDPSTSQNPPAYYVASYTITYENEFNKFKQYFSLKPFTKLATKTKKLILENDYSNAKKYELTQNLERSKSALSYGDFDNDGITDVAIILDNNESQVSRLLVICTNAITKDPYLAYAENYNDKMRMNAFKKKAKVYMNTSSLVPSPYDGLILKADDVKIAVIYDKQNQKFKTYYQPEDEDIIHSDDDVIGVDYTREDGYIK